LNIDINKLKTTFYENQKKPKVDLFTTLTASGLAGTPQSASPFGSLPVSEVPEVLVGSNAQSLGNILNRRFPTVQAGVRISLPLTNRTAAAQSAKSQTEGRKLQVQKKQIEMYVEADVRNALEQLNSMHSRYEAAQIAAEAANEQYASEQRQFEAGTSSMFLVLERQTGVISARSNEVRARADLGKSIAGMDRALARVFEKYKIKLDQ
jgi:outer membrane protein TolC